MNSLEKVLNRTYKNLQEACIEAGIEFTETIELNSIELCANCGIWNKKGLMKPDLDGAPVCQMCRLYYGD